MSAASKKQQIELIARGVCVQNGMVLVCRNRRHGNVYLPGGHVDWGEDSRQALEREWMEELGVPARIGGFLGVIEQTYDSRDGAACEISLVFTVECPAISAAAAPPSAEAYIEFEWVQLPQLENSGLLPVAMARQVPLWLEAPDAVAGRWVGYAPPD